jgi:hypothetical protein
VSEAALRRILVPVTAAVLLAYYWFFVSPGLRLYFDNDDMMNLYFAWSKPLIQNYRPLGAWFYRAMFAQYGFSPSPFRVVCLVLGAVNMGLCYWFARIVTASDRTAALSVLLFAFHSRMMEVWYRTAVVYDLLCFTFLYLAACLYMIRPRPGVLRGITIAVCFVAALEAKEVAVVLPVVLLAWDLTHGLRGIAIVVCFVAALEAKEVAVVLPVVLLAWDLTHGAGIRASRIPLLCGLIDIPYLWFKTHGPNALAALADYQPQYTLTRFSHTWALYLNYLFLLKDQIVPWMALAILCGLLLAALRSKKLLFAWIVLFVPVFPVAFLEYRGAFVLYTSYPGWTLYAAILLVSAQDLIKVHRTALACVVFVIVGCRWGKINLHDQRADPRIWLHESPAQVQQMADALPALAPQMQTGTRCLFLKDPFSTSEWTPYFIMKLFYRDDTLVADRAKMMTNPPNPDDYQFVFTYETGQYRRLKPL